MTAGFEPTHFGIRTHTLWHANPNTSVFEPTHFGIRTHTFLASNRATTVQHRNSLNNPQHVTRVTLNYFGRNHTKLLPWTPRPTVLPNNKRLLNLSYPPLPQHYLGSLGFSNKHVNYCNNLIITACTDSFPIPYEIYRPK